RRVWSKRGSAANESSGNRMMRKPSREIGRSMVVDLVYPRLRFGLVCLASFACLISLDGEGDGAAEEGFGVGAAEGDGGGVAAGRGVGPVVEVIGVLKDVIRAAALDELRLGGLAGDGKADELGERFFGEPLGGVCAGTADAEGDAVLGTADFELVFR